MLARSDNVATNVLIDVLGRESITRFCAGLGLSATVVRRKLSGSLPLIDDPGRPGPQRASGRRRRAPSPSHRARRASPAAAWLLDVLSRQEWNGKLNGGLQPGDRFAHKTGDTDEVSHDGGILTTAEGLRYVVVLYAAVGVARRRRPALCARHARAARSCCSGRGVARRGEAH